MASVFSDFTMVDTQTQITNPDYLQPGFAFDDGFGFSPATSPARDMGKQDFTSYLNSEPLTFGDHGEGDLFNNFTQLSQLQVTTPSGFSSVNSKLVNGQVTPPSDNSPVTPKREVHNEPTPVSLDEDKSVTQPGRRKRGSQASQPSAQSSAKRRKSSARKGSSDSNDCGDEQDEKRSKFLERNRVAASKCRQKKKEWTSNLEQRARELQQNKAQLTLLVNSLRDEVLYLKGEVLKHDNCNCTALRNYMSRSISQLSGNPAVSDKLQLPTSQTPLSDLDLDGMSFAGSPRLASPEGSPSTANVSTT